MRTSEREQAFDTLVSLVRLARQGEIATETVLPIVESLSDLVGTVPQSHLARCTHRSRPTIRKLVSDGVLPSEAGGHIPALTAALATVALENSGHARDVGRRVAETAEWLNESRDPAFRAGLASMLSGQPLQEITPSVAGEEADRVLEEFLRTQAEAGREDEPV